MINLIWISIALDELKIIENIIMFQYLWNWEIIIFDLTLTHFDVICGGRLVDLDLRYLLPV